MSNPESPTPGPKGASLARLVDVMDQLLAPDGCPWDREQTLDTLAPYLVEETFEVLDALDSGSPADHREELGDLLMQIVFQAALRERAGEFDIDGVCQDIVAKLVRRHPHVFGDARADDPAAVEAQWERIKEREKGRRKGTLAGVPAALPALPRAQKLSARAAKVGFDWPDVAGCMDKVREELGEIDGAMAEGNAGDIEHEVGDLLFAAVSLARKLGVDAETALRRANGRFETRFGHVEDRLAERGSTPTESTLSELDALWNDAKKSERDRR